MPTPLPPHLALALTGPVTRSATEFTPFTPEEEQSLLSQLGSGAISGLAAAGNFLDLPGSSVRDFLTGNNPLDQWATPFSDINRTTGRQVLADYGLATPNDPSRWEWQDFGGGLAEVALDPFFWLPHGALSRAGGQAAKLIPQTVRQSRLGRAVGEVADAGLRTADMLFNPDVRGLWSREGQAAGRALSGAMERVGPEQQAARALNSQIMGRVTNDFQQEAGDHLLQAMRSAPLVPDPRDIHNFAQELARGEQAGFDDPLLQSMRRWKQEHLPLVRAAQRVHNAGGDISSPSLERFGMDLVHRTFNEEVMGARPQDVYTGVDDVGAGGLTEDEFWSFLLSPSHRPVRGEFMTQAANDIINRGVTGGDARPLQAGSAVRVRGSQIGQEFGEYADEFSPELDDIPDSATGFLTRVGSRESDVLFRKGDQLATRKVKNTQLFGVENAEVQAQRANDFYQHVMDDIMRSGAELASRNADSFGDAVLRQYERFAGLGGDDVDVSRQYSRTLGNLQRAFGAGGPGVGMGEQYARVAAEMQETFGERSLPWLIVHEAMARLWSEETGRHPDEWFSQGMIQRSDPGQVGPGALEQPKAYTISLGRRGALADSAEKLSAAEQMAKAGKGPDEIRSETGWYRGQDQVWRNDVVSDDVSLLMGGDKKIGEELSRGRVVRLGEMIDSPLIFGSYPELRDYTVRIAQKGFKNSADINTSTKVIRLSGDLSGDSLKDTLVHEIAHHIQDAEGFKYGDVSSRGAKDHMQGLSKAIRDLIARRDAIHKVPPGQSATGSYINYSLEDDAGLSRDDANRWLYIDADIAHLRQYERHIRKLVKDRSYWTAPGEIEARAAEADVRDVDAILKRYDEAIAHASEEVEKLVSKYSAASTDTLYQSPAKLHTQNFRDVLSYAIPDNPRVNAAYKAFDNYLASGGKATDPQGAKLLEKVAKLSADVSGQKRQAAWDTALSGLAKQEDELLDALQEQWGTELADGWKGNLRRALTGNEDDLRGLLEDVAEQLRRAYPDVELPAEQLEQALGTLRQKWSAADNTGPGGMVSDMVEALEQVEPRIDDFRDLEFARVNEAIGEWIDEFNLYQPGARRSGARGAVTFSDDGSWVIHAFQNADLSTLVHESSHVFRRSLEQMGETGQRLLRQAADAIGESGITVLDANGRWTREADEAWANQFERYSRDGHAPNQALRRVFDKFKQWLTDIYRSIVGTPLEQQVHPQLKQVFDQMLTPQVNQISGELTALKNNAYDDLAGLGLKINKHTAGEAGQFQTDHWPRYVPRKLALDFEKKGLTAKDFNTSFESMKMRRAEIRDLPTHVVNELLLNRRYRGNNAARNIQEDFGQYLSDSYGTRPSQQGDLSDMLDPDSFDPQAIEAWGSAANAGETGIEAHLRDLTEWVSDHRRQSLFTQTMQADMDRYLRGAYRTKAGVLGLHEFLNSSAARGAARGENGLGSIPLSQVYENAGAFDLDQVKKFYSEKFKIAPERFDQLRVSRKEAETALGYQKILNNEQQLDGPIGQAIDGLNQMFKSGVTVPFPGFHFRNFLSGQIVNWSIGNVPVSKYLKNLKDTYGLVQRAAQDQLTDADLQLVNELFLHQTIDPKLAGQGVTAVSGYTPRHTRDPLDIIPKPFGGVYQNRESALTDVLAAEVPDSLQSFAQIPGATSVRTTLQQIVGTGANTGSLIEFLNRVPLYKTLREQGMDAAAAARRVEELHFNYGKSTNFERKFAKRLFPFYTFSKNMATLTAKELMDRPGGKLAQMIRVNRLMQGEQLGTPDYISQGTSIPLGDMPDGSQRFVTGLGLAHEDPLSLMTAGRESGLPMLRESLAELGSRTTPLVKAPIELMFNETLFQQGPSGGRELTDLDPTMGRLGSNIAEMAGFGPIEDASGRAYPLGGSTFEHLMANSPLSRVFTTARTLTDPRKYSGDYPGLAAATNFLTGVRISDVPQRSQDAVIRERAQAYARENLGAKSYEAVYIPKDQIEAVRKDDPEGARQMEAINRLRQIFKKRQEGRDGQGGGGKQPGLALTPGT